MREIRLHDTRSGKIVPLEPRDPGRVGIYACGPTVYSRIHIGNARPFVVFMLLKRFLEHEGYNTTLVVNITDVNDKIYAAAEARARVQGNAAERSVAKGGDLGRRAGSGEMNSKALAAEMTRHYLADTSALGLGRPDHEPLASETIEAIVTYIEDLIASDHAYVVEYRSEGGLRCDVLFRVRSDPEYGSLSHRRIDDMDQGEGIEGADRKEDPLDFALWKGRKKGEDSWDPAKFVRNKAVAWGPGRPGWHIECSAMAELLLGVGFEIHGGGSDLVFPHHENEAAQTRCARGAELARIWMHNGMIQMTGEKMAKSMGNIALLHEVLERCDRGEHEWSGHARATVIMYLVGGHYRQPLAFSDAELHDADLRVLRIREAMRRLIRGEHSPPDMARHKKAFFDALADDFNTPKAVASLFEWVREANGRTGPVGDADLREMLSALGIDDMEPLQAVGNIEAIDPEAAELLHQREEARRDRDFERADRLREQIRLLIEERGWEIRDTANGPELIPKW